MVQPCQVKCSQPCQAKVRFGVGERSTNDIRTDFLLFLFSFSVFLLIIRLVYNYPFFIFFILRRISTSNSNWWWRMWFFFLSISTEWPHRGDPTSGVYEQPTNTHFFALGCGVVFWWWWKRTHIRPIRHKGIMEKYPPFPKGGLIYLSSFFVFVFVIFVVIIIISERECTWLDWWGKRISSIRNGSLIQYQKCGVPINE